VVALADDASSRGRWLTRALAFEYVSVAWGTLSATWSITGGVLSGSLGILGLGLNVAADMAGSSILVWRFRVERRDPGRAPRAELKAVVVVALGLAAVAVFLALQASRALASHSAAAG
jgi:divalent metal cation (Fe/Co/Zn/Cd) transporter